MRTGRPRRSASRHVCTCRLMSSRAPNAPPTPPRTRRTALLRQAEAGGDLLAVLVQPLRGDVQLDAAAVVVGDGQRRLEAEERLVLHADLVGALDDDVAGGVGVAADDPLVAQDVAVGVDRRVRAGDRRLRVEQRFEHLVRRRRWRRAPGGTSPGGRRRRRRPARRRSARGRWRTPAGRRRSARTSGCPGTSSAVSTVATPGIASAVDTSIDTMRAYGCGERSVAPHAAPSIGRSDEKANAALGLGDAVGPGRRVADAARPSTRVPASVSVTRARRVRRRPVARRR